MQEQTHWADLSEQLLLRTFESQHNALDNCAAACACKRQPHTVSSPAFKSPVTKVANKQLFQIALLHRGIETDCWGLFQGGDYHICKFKQEYPMRIPAV